MRVKIALRTSDNLAIIECDLDELADIQSCILYAMCDTSNRRGRLMAMHDRLSNLVLHMLGIPSTARHKPDLGSPGATNKPVSPSDKSGLP
jgi:hypothetical protein